MAGEMLKLISGVNEYVLSGVNRRYERGYYFAGTVSRAVTGSLNLCKRALKTVHTVAWDDLPYDDTPDGGIGLADLRDLFMAGGVYTLRVQLFEGSLDTESFDVIFDPEAFFFNLVPGYGREFWRVSATFLEV